MRTFGALAGAVIYFSDSATSWWRMTTDANWIAMSQPSGIVGQGSGPDYFTVAANFSSESRTATITGCNGQAFTIHQAGRTPATGHYVANDFDGDGRADIAIYRRSNGRWYVLLSSTDYSDAGALSVDTGSIGGAGTPFAGDFDGDGRSDLTVLNPCCSEGHLATYYSTDEFGPATPTFVEVNNLPLPVIFAADFDGSGKSQLTVYDPGEGAWEWWHAPSPGVTYPSFKQWGAPGDAPVPADFDGDGVTDFAVWRASEGRWYVLESSTGFDYAHAHAHQWGSLGDIPFAADVDGDGRADLIVWRPSNGTWYINLSSHNYNPASAVAIQWGTASDMPVPADYDGDGRTDLAIWRPSTGVWYLLFSSSNYAYASARAVQWGSTGFADQPVGTREAPRVPHIHATCAAPTVAIGDVVTCPILVDLASNPDSGYIQFAHANLNAFAGASDVSIQHCYTCSFNEFDLTFQVPAGTTPGVKTIPIWAVDYYGRRADGTATVTVAAR